MTDTLVSPYGIRPEAFRLPDDTRVGRVRLQVADLENKAPALRIGDLKLTID